MPITPYRYLTASMLFPILLAVNACGTSPPSRFYLLEPLTGSDSAHSLAAKPGELHIGVGPIQFAEYLDRTQIVTRTGSTQVQLAETHRWAEPLQRNFARILAENLSILLPTDRVSLHRSRNWPDIDYQVLVNVWQLDARKQGEVALVANWSIRTDHGKELVTMKKSVFNTTLEPEASYAEIAAAMSETVAMLSREIAGAIRAAQD